MALPLLPPLEAGATTAERRNLLGWGDFDFFGVQSAPVATTDDMRGPNEIFRFHRDAFTFIDAEHDANGIHDTFQIARVFLRCDYDSTDGYTVHPESYAMGTRFKADATAFTITAGTAGEITVDLAAGLALPDGTYMGCADRSAMTYGTLAEALFVRTQLRSITDSTTFLLRRREGSAADSLSLAHGPFAVAIFAV